MFYVQGIDNKNQKKLSALNKARALNGLDQNIKHEFLSRISKCKYINSHGGGPALGQAGGFSRLDRWRSWVNEIKRFLVITLSD